MNELNYQALCSGTDMTAGADNKCAMCSNDTPLTIIYLIGIRLLQLFGYRKMTADKRLVSATAALKYHLFTVPPDASRGVY